jgi:GWxTD domain-containing protein
MRVSGLCTRLLLVLLCLYFGIPVLSARGQEQRPANERKEKQLKGIAANPYQRWLDEDVCYIIFEQERAEFNKLTTDQQRDAFIVAFWDRRNPTPQSPENPYKEEHYRRIAYANTHFAATVPGYRTDRGRFYIMFGPPDSVDSKSAFARQPRHGITFLWKGSVGTSCSRLRINAFAGNMNCRVRTRIPEFPKSLTL